MIQSSKAASFEAVFFFPSASPLPGSAKPSLTIVSSKGEEFRSHSHPFLAMKSFVTLKKKEGQH